MKAVRDNWIKWNKENEKDYQAIVNYSVLLGFGLGVWVAFIIYTLLTL